MGKLNVISMSYGKDSTATALLAIESGETCKFVFADTGNEHEITYEYGDYLRKKLGIEIDVVRADLSDKVLHKKTVVMGKWVENGSVTAERAAVISGLLEPTGNPFLDLCLWKGRFPSAKAAFCTMELKHGPLDAYFLKLREKNKNLESWQGVRAAESKKRAQLPIREKSELYEIYRPVLSYSAQQVFDLHKKHGIKPNPLYKMGMGRVGCMPCVNARKGEINQISNRFPDVISRIDEWESLVSATSKNNSSTFFHGNTMPGNRGNTNIEITTESHGIKNIVKWAATTRGGKQYPLEQQDFSMCSSLYGLCE